MRLIDTINSWLEWQDAKYWVKAIHPAWVYLASKRYYKDPIFHLFPWKEMKNDNGEIRKMYRQKILALYKSQQEEEYK